MENIRGELREIKDTRHRRYVKHKLSDVLILVTGTVISGITKGNGAVSHEDKTNENPVFQTMLDNLNIEGKAIKAYAPYCQKEACATIIKKGGNYILGLKGKQGSPLEDVKLFF